MSLLEDHECRKYTAMVIAPGSVRRATGCWPLEKDVAQGDDKEQFLRNIYERHFAEITAYVFKTFGAGPPEPDDIAQETFAKIAALEDPFQLENPRSFLYVTAKNLVFDFKRRARIRRDYVKDSIRHTHDEGSESFSPENLSLIRQRLNIIYNTLKSMPGKRQRIFMLSRYDGLSIAEMARRLNMSETGVRKHVQRALSDCVDALKTADRTADAREDQIND